MLRTSSALLLVALLGMFAKPSDANRLPPGGTAPSSHPCRCRKKRCRDGLLEVRLDPNALVRVCTFRKFSPADFLLKPGNYTVSVTNPRCKKPVRFKVKVRAGKTTELRRRWSCK